MLELIEASAQKLNDVAEAASVAAESLSARRRVRAVRFIRGSWLRGYAKYAGFLGGEKVCPQAASTSGNTGRRIRYCGTSSTRRFCALPSSLALEVTGANWPTPAASSRMAASP